MVDSDAYRRGREYGEHHNPNKVVQPFECPQRNIVARVLDAALFDLGIHRFSNHDIYFIPGGVGHYVACRRCGRRSYVSDY